MKKRYALYFDLESFVRRYDTELGTAHITKNIDEALKFDNFEEADAVADKLGRIMVIEVTHITDDIYCQ
ncbi:hypothetical protein HB943_02100 [Listeria weihenstephanensis]|uniref:Uncharacterized protein n=1 Tax=Listeria weihenstephanensis TaxID=1006155 RepID=A0A841Z385_9LIST|nr:hypothetical protein [Listeria weihenstephanensis]MBC1499379.1 hypothetical protein [Listeria weihenstephanensis]